MKKQEITISFFIDHSESFEILSAKRAIHHPPNSLNYWFLPKYIKFIFTLYFELFIL